jgi:hypothetical protein
LFVAVGLRHPSPMDERSIACALLAEISCWG